WKIGITAVPLERLRAREVLDRTVVYDIDAKTVRLKVPLEPVEGRVDMAIGAAELSLKRVFRCVDDLSAAAQGRYLLRPAEVPQRNQLVARSINHTDGVIHPA